MINGAHVILYSADAPADRAFLRDVLDLRHVDVGAGWLIFALPEAEAAVHPADGEARQELYLMCDDVAVEVRRLEGLGVRCDPVTQASWGRVTRMQLPGGGKLGLYQPRHARP
jgi:hypothetical protein